MILVLYILLVVYIITISLLIYGFSKVRDFEVANSSPNTKFSILVPFRNESKNLPILLESFSKLKYPVHLFEVILIDDYSDETCRLPDLNFTISILKNIRVSNSPKKDAIATAIRTVKTDWIITTDADCVHNENWLATLDHYIQNHEVSMIVGSVSYSCNSSFLHKFQQFDFTGLQGATIGSFGLGKGFICNGANFAYRKSFFHELDGFIGNDQIASGDDVFLLQKAMSRWPKKVHYLKSKSTIVHTKPLDNWNSLFNQRVRWVSKTSSFESGFGVYLGFVVLSINILWILVLGSVLMGLMTFEATFYFFILKFLVEFFLIRKTHFFLNDGKLSYTILSSIIHPFFSIGIALYSAFGKYEWKGRKFN